MKIRNLYTVVIIILLVINGIGTQVIANLNETPEKFYTSQDLGNFQSGLETKENLSIEEPPEENLELNFLMENNPKTEEFLVNLKDLNLSEENTFLEINFSKEEVTKNLSSENPTKKETNFSSSSQKKVENNSESSISTENPPEQNKIKKIEMILSKDGKKELEGMILETINIKDIQKIEIEKEEGIKEVIIKSEEHVETPLTVYSDIPETPKDQKSSVKIYWKNENKEIEIKEFIDEDKNGLYDRISWIVPHLSEQIFEIIITPYSEEDPLLTKIILEPLSPKMNEILTNPIEFQFNISYLNLTNVICNLSIDNSLSSATTNILPKEKSLPWPDSLEDGNHSWELLCLDRTNQSEENSISGKFTINENFSLSLENKIYLLGEEIKLKMNSNQESLKTIKIINPDSISYTVNNIKENSYTIDPSIINKEGIYKINVSFDNLEEIYVLEKNFSVAKIELDVQETEIETGEDTTISVNINSPGEKITSVILDFLDGQSNIDSYQINTNSFTKSFIHSYSQTGDYLPRVLVGIGGKTYTITNQNIEVTSGEDSENPEITLISPKNSEIITKDSVTFSYKAEDNENLSSCTYELYNESGSFGKLEYTKTTNNLENNKIVEIPLKEFDEGIYTWYVGCYDNSSNYQEESRTFTISFSGAVLTTDYLTNLKSTYSEQTEVEQTISNLETFLTKAESFDLDKKQILEDLGISTELTYYKKRLLQIDQDLSYNLKFISDTTLREKREQETINEFNKIKDSIPTNVEVIEKKEFTKNSIPKDMKQLLSEYFQFKKEKISNRELTKLSELNEELQNKISFLTKASTVKIQYKNHSQELTLISKEITLKEENPELIIESIPSTISKEKIVFLTESKEIKENSLYEISPEEKKIVYYIEEVIDIDHTEELETILFKDYVIENSKITGLFLLDIGDSNPILSYILLIIFLFIIFYVIKKILKRIKIEKYKKQGNGEKTLELIKQSILYLKHNEIGSAKENYHKLKELYPLLQEELKGYVYKDIKKIRMGIDKRDIFSLVKEYEKAKDQGRKIDSQKIYQEVKEVYKRLNKKDQTKIYNKIFKPSFEF